MTGDRPNGMDNASAMPAAPTSSDDRSVAGKITQGATANGSEHPDSETALATEQTSIAEAASSQQQRPTEPRHSGRAAEQATVRLIWSEATRNILGLDSSTGPSLTADLGSELHQLRTRIRAEIVTLMQAASGARSRLGKVTAIRYHTMVGVASQDWRPVDIEDESYGSRLNQVSDLFRGAVTADGLLNATVTLQLETLDEEPPAKKAKKSKASGPAKDVDELVHTLGMHPELIRVGETLKTKKKADPVPKEWPILAEIDRETKTLVDVWQTEGWNLHHWSVGGFHLDKSHVKLPLLKRTPRRWYQDFKGVKTKKELQARIFRPVATDPLLPFRPNFTFTPFSTQGHTSSFGSVNIGRFPSGVDVLVRVFGHLESNPNDDLQINHQFQVDDTSDYWSVVRLIEERLQSRKDTRPLFEESMRDRWELELWAMPQDPGQPLLYRFEQTDIKSAPPLVKTFLSEQSIDDGHRRLYMEAHILPKKYPPAE